MGIEDQYFAADIVQFVESFFDDRGIPFRLVLGSDRIQSDLNLNRVLWNDWEYDFDEEFKDRFGVSPLKQGVMSYDMTISLLIAALSDIVIAKDLKN